MAKDFLELMKEGEALVAMRDKSTRITNFNEKVASLINLIVNKPGHRSSMRKALLEEAASSSEFPIIFGTILDRQLLAKYQIAKPDWRTYIKVGSQMDFRPQEPIGVFGLQGPLAVVQTQGEYKQDAVLGSGAVTISLQKFGRRFGLGWELMINDDLGAFSDIADRLANAALRTEFRQATQLFVGAGGPLATLFGTPIVHPIDGKNVTNKLTGAPSALSFAAIATAIQTFRQMVDSDGEPIMIDGWELVVPPALEVTMYGLLRSQLLLLAGGDSTANAKAQVAPNANVISNFNITGHVNQYLPIIDQSANKNTTWYLFAKLSNGCAAQLNFLRGHESPELCMRAPNKTSLTGQFTNPLEGDFDQDSMDWRVRHIMGGNRIDPRMAVVSIGA